MKTLTSFLVVLLGLALPADAALPTHGSVGSGHGVNVPGKDSVPCQADLLVNWDGSAEDGYCWQYGGIVPPQYGAFAECYQSNGDVCGIELNLTSIGNPTNTATLFVWGDAGGVPGNVLAQTNAMPANVPRWPNFGVFDYALSSNASGNVWVGYWANFANQSAGYYVAADLNGFGGCPVTDIAPGIGYPTGWNNVSIVWGPTQALGIGVWEGQCGPHVRCGGGGPGPCCLPDGSCQWIEDCPGYWSPTNTCAPSPCVPMGACCAADGDCTITTQANCTTPDIWVGAGFACAPTPCGATSGVPGRKTVLMAPLASPNPAVGQVTIYYGVPVATDVSLTILDATGRSVRRLVNASQGVGNHSVTWDRRDDAGRVVTAGVYLARVSTVEGPKTARVVILQ